MTNIWGIPLTKNTVVVTAENLDLISSTVTTDQLDLLGGATALYTPSTLVLRDASGRAALDLCDDSDTPITCLDHNARLLINSLSANTIDWENKVLYQRDNGTDYLSVNWGSFTLNSWMSFIMPAPRPPAHSDFESLNWQDCQLKSTTIVFDSFHPPRWHFVYYTSLDWHQCQLLSTDGSESLNWDGYYTNYYGGGGISIDYGGGCLYDTSSIASFDWNNRVTFDAVGTVSASLNDRTLLGEDGYVVASWSNDGFRVWLGHDEMMFFNNSTGVAGMSGITLYPSSAPSSPAEGQMYVDNASGNHLYIYLNGAWSLII